MKIGNDFKNIYPLFDNDHNYQDNENNLIIKVKCQLVKMSHSVSLVQSPETKFCQH